MTFFLPEKHPREAPCFQTHVTDKNVDQLTLRFLRSYAHRSSPHPKRRRRSSKNSVKQESPRTRVREHGGHRGNLGSERLEHVRCELKLV